MLAISAEPLQMFPKAEWNYGHHSSNVSQKKNTDTFKHVSTYFKTRTAASFSSFFPFFAVLLFCLCCAFLLTCRYNVFTGIWYPNTPKFYNPISNTDSSFTNSHKLKSQAHPNHTQNSSQLVSIAHTYPHNQYQPSSKTLGPNHPITRNLTVTIQKLQQPAPRGANYITTYTR